MKPFISLLGKKKNLNAAPPVDGSVPDLKPDLNNSGAFQLGAGLLQTLDKQKAPTSAVGEAGRSLVKTGLDTVLPGVGTAADAIGKITQNFTRNEDGSYKNDFAKVAENMNVLNLTSNLLSGDFSGKKKQAEFKYQKKRKQALDNYGSKLMDAQNQANIYKNKNTFMPYLAQKGGNLTADCGCNKGSDGFDTDLFHKFPESSMVIIQEVAGTKKDGKYKESDKVAIKRKAQLSGKKLIDYLNTIPSFKETLVVVESKKKGGLLFKGISKLKK